MLHLFSCSASWLPPKPAAVQHGLGEGNIEKFSICGFTELRRGSDSPIDGAQKAQGTRLIAGKSSLFTFASEETVMEHDLWGDMSQRYNITKLPPGVVA